MALSYEKNLPLMYSSALKVLMHFSDQLQ